MNEQIEGIIDGFAAEIQRITEAKINDADIVKISNAYIRAKTEFNKELENLKEFIGDNVEERIEKIRLSYLNTAPESRNKIQAIKAVRDIKNLDLKESKYLVDSWR